MKPSLPHSLPILTKVDSTLIQKWEIVLNQFRTKAKDLPEASYIYFNQPGEREYPRVPSGLTFDEFQVALQLWDLHSMICGLGLLHLWKVEELVEVLWESVSGQRVLSAVMAGRSLLEICSAFAVEALTNATALKQALEQKSHIDPYDATEIRLRLQSSVLAQGLIGTRREEFLKLSTAWKRTNILTIIEKAAPILRLKDLRSRYEFMCDAVHPNLGSHSCFIAEQGINDEIHQIRWVVGRRTYNTTEPVPHLLESTALLLESLCSAMDSMKEAVVYVAKRLKISALGAKYHWSE